MDENKIVLFQQETAPIIATIIKKYGLEETPEVAFQKLKEGKLFNAGIILNLAQDVVLKKIDDLKFISSLIEEFKISQDVAENILKDIQENLIAGATETDAPIEKHEEVKNLTEQSAQQAKDIVSNIKMDEELGEIEEPEKELPKTKVMEKELPEKITESPKQASGPDSYREPIE